MTTTWFVRTLECTPGANYGAIVDRTPYDTHTEAVIVRDRCIRDEEDARARGERDKVWYLFDIAEVKEERPVVASGDVGGPGNRARAWARRKQREFIQSIEEHEA